MTNPEELSKNESMIKEKRAQILSSDESCTLSSLLRDSVCPMQIISPAEDTEIFYDTSIDPSDISSRINLVFINAPIEWLGRVTPKFNSNRKLLEKAVNCDYFDLSAKKNIFSTLNIIKNYFVFFDTEHGRLINKKLSNSLREDIHSFFTFGENLLYKNLGKFEEIISQDNNLPLIMTSTKSILRTINSLARITTNDQIRKDSIDFILRNFENIIRNKEKYFKIAEGEKIDDFLRSANLLKTLTELGNVSQLEVGKQMLIKMLKNRNSIASTMAFAELKNYWKLNPSHTIIREILLEDNAESGKTVFSYDEARFENLMSMTEPRLFFENIQSICQLENERQGITDVLFKEFGITHFAIYPEVILIDQYDEFIKLGKNNRKGKDFPYGIVVNPQVDTIGAFADEKEMYKKFYDQLQENGYGLKIYEVENIKKLVYAFCKSHLSYGEISFAILGGQASGGNQLDLSPKGGKERNLSHDKLKKKIAKVVRSTLAKHPIIVLNSCLIGALDNSLGQKISELDAEVIGTGAHINIIKEIKIKILDGNRIDFSVDYANENGETIGANVFEKGACIKENLQTINFLP
jgi:hypothetical protein